MSQRQNLKFENLQILEGVSTQKQSSGFVAHENSTFRNLALAVSGPFMAYMGALLYFKCAFDSTLVYVCLAYADNASLCGLFCHRLPGALPR